MSGPRANLARLAFALACVLVAPRAVAAPPDAPNAAAVAEAKKLFERGLKLYKEKAFREALALFIRANELSPRASIQKNIAQCYRDLLDFASAYDAYNELLERYGATLPAAEIATIKAVVAELTLLTGAISVTITEPGATVRIDEREVGTTPMTKPIRVKLARYKVVVTKAGFEPLTKDVEIAAGATVSIDGPLVTEVKTGHVSVRTKGAGDARVFVDGAEVGPAPWEGDVPPGSHTFEARGATVTAAPVRVDVARRANVDVSLELRARVGKVTVDSHTVDAEISIDGQAVGKGGWEGELPVGRHELSITLKRFETHRRVLFVSEAQTVEDVHLQPVAVPAPIGPTYVGIYSNLDFFGVASPADATNALAQSCPTQPCQASSPLGAGLAVRVGYSFGYVGVEGMALGMYDSSDASMSFRSALAAPNPNQGIARDESFRFHRYGGGGAIGGRVTTKDPNIRFTFGTALGLAYKGMIYKRDASATGADQKTGPGGTTGSPLTSTFTSSAATYTAPVIILDLGIQLGSATGPKFRIGALALFELVGDPVLAPGDDTRTLGNGSPSPKLGTPPLQLASGTQFFIGPVIGLHFGE